MKWDGNRESDHVEDRRDVDGSSGRGGFGGRSLEIDSIAIALVASYFLGINPMTVLDLLSGGNPTPQTQQIESPKAPPRDIMAKFVSTVLAGTEDVWTNVFAQNGAT
jgi:predicted metalloprotease